MSSNFTPQSGGMDAKDFTNYLIYINVYMIVLILTYFIFFNTEMKRKNENELGKNLKDNSELSDSLEEKEALRQNEEKS